MKFSKTLWLWLSAIAIILIVIIVLFKPSRHKGSVNGINRQKIGTFEQNLKAPKPYLNFKQSAQENLSNGNSISNSAAEFNRNNREYRNTLKNIMDNTNNISVMIGAAGILANQGDKKAKEYLVKLLKTSPGNGIKVLAAVALAQAGDMSGYKDVDRIAENGDWGTRIYAGRALGYFGTQGLSTLKAMRNSRDGWIRYGADAGLAKLGDDEAIRELIGGLSHYDPAVRIFCAESLADIHNPNAIAYLEHEFSSSDPDEKFHGAKYLYILDKDNRAKAYLEQIADSDSSHKYDAIITLAQ
jgi:HEAT repeat protein